MGDDLTGHGIFLDSSAKRHSKTKKNSGKGIDYRVWSFKGIMF
jgi:hypothetical protein